MPTSVKKPRAKKPAYRIEVYRAVDSQYRWRLVAKNNLIVADGAEGYATAGNALRAVKGVQKRFAEAAVVRLES